MKERKYKLRLAIGRLSQKITRYIVSLPYLCQSINNSKEMIFNGWKAAVMCIGGMAGWLIGEFRPTFPLIVVAIVFILYDAFTAFRLDQRVHTAYPDKISRKKVKFTSFAFGKVVKQTIPKRLWLIILAYLAEHWVFVHVSIPLSYIVTGVICFEQAWSIFENESSCRSDEDSRLWKMLQKIMVDKTSRHFDVNLDNLKSESVSDEQIDNARKRMNGDIEEGGEA